MTPERLIHNLRRADIDPRDVGLLLNTRSDRDGGAWIITTAFDGREVYRSVSLFQCLRFVRRYEALRAS